MRMKLRKEKRPSMLWKWEFFTIEDEISLIEWVESSLMEDQEDGDVEKLIQIEKRNKRNL